MTDLKYDPIASLRSNGTGLLDSAAALDRDVAINSCPGWRANDVVFHVTKVWNFWTAVVAEQIQDKEQVVNMAELPRPGDDELFDWSRECLEKCAITLEKADKASEFWTWTGANRPVSWVRRRMAQETAVHRWDIENASQSGWKIDPVVASDGIDEFLMWMAPRMARTAAPVDGTVHIHCTDADGEWTITKVEKQNVIFDRSHTSCDTAIKGEANSLLLWIWRRDGGPLQIFGDIEVARRFQAFAHLG